MAFKTTFKRAFEPKSRAAFLNAALNARLNGYRGLP